MDKRVKKEEELQSSFWTDRLICPAIAVFLLIAFHSSTAQARNLKRRSIRTRTPQTTIQPNPRTTAVPVVTKSPKPPEVKRSRNVPTVNSKQTTTTQHPSKTMFSRKQGSDDQSPGKKSTSADDWNPYEPSRVDPKNPTAHFYAPNPYTGKPSRVRSQSTVSDKYLPQEGQEASFLKELIPYNTKDRKPHPYVDSSPVWKMLDSVSYEDEKRLGMLLYLTNDSDYDFDARHKIQQAMTDQGYQWNVQNPTKDPTAKRLFLAKLGDWRLPSVGIDGQSRFNALIITNNGKGNPQIAISWPNQLKVLLRRYNSNPYMALGHEFEHSVQLEYPKYDPILGLDLRRDVMGDSRNGPIYKHVTEFPAVFSDIVFNATMFKAQTKKDLDAAILFPSGKQVSLTWMERMAHRYYAFSADPKLGRPRTFTELLSTPEGVQWWSQLYGSGGGKVLSGFGKKVGAGAFTPEGLQIIKTNLAAQEFLEKFD